MAVFSMMIDDIRTLDSYIEKTQILKYIMNICSHPGFRLDDEDREYLSILIFTEVKRLIRIIPDIESYREKDAAMDYANELIYLIPFCHESNITLPWEGRDNVNKLIEIMGKERYIENEIDEIFEKRNTSPTDFERLFCMLVPLKDEYHKGMFYQGMLHYQNTLSILPGESVDMIAEYIANEMERYLSCEMTEEVSMNLEFAADLCTFFINGKIAGLLQRIIDLGINDISFYAVRTLLCTKYSVTKEVINSLARDLVHANNTYALLKKLNKTDLFPAELATPEYLAKSDLVHWLSYPTELGKEPDEIEYLGSVRKKSIYYIFKYKSDSDCLGDDVKNKWLLGWSNIGGGTFSNFDLYDNFVQQTTEKTLKYIKKKLL